MSGELPLWRSKLGRSYHRATAIVNRIDFNPVENFPGLHLAAAAALQRYDREQHSQYPLADGEPPLRNVYQRATPEYQRAWRRAVFAAWLAGEAGVYEGGEGI